MTKPRIHSIAKELDVKSTELLDLLKDFDSEVKNHMSTLTNFDMDIIFEHYTKLFDDGGNFNEFFGVEEKAVDEKKEEKIIEKVAKKQNEPIVETTKTERTSRYVNTRPEVFDPTKLDTEKLEELAPTVKDDFVAKEKIKTKSKVKQERAKEVVAPKVQKEKKREKTEIEIPETITVADLAEKMEVSSTEVIKKLMMLDIMATINQSIDFETASLVAGEFEIETKLEIIMTDEEKLIDDFEDTPESLISRPPVVVVMGHVDHGKTSLLDAIRSTNVIDKEAGGITQHIGAYSVKINGKPITFLDTPGHEAFTAMRARGAKVTDIAILVVAADDGIMPQTVEAINHAKAAGISIIIAINKIDKEAANPDRVLQELTEHGIIAEEWGGDTVCVKISAKQRINIDGLLEMVTLTAEMLELKANPNRWAKGTVIESNLDKGRGPVATVLVQDGTLKTGDIVIAGTAHGKVRTMLDDKGRKVAKVTPGFPVEVVGLSHAPDGGDEFYVVKSEKIAREIVEGRQHTIKEASAAAVQNVSLEDLFSQIQTGEVKDLNIIVKADVQGSVEAVRQSLEKISNEEVRVRVIHGAVGGIREADVSLAIASNAIIVGFNVRPDTGATNSAQTNNIDIRLYRVIYEAIEEIEASIKGMLAPKFKEVVIGHAEVRQTYKVSSIGTIAGCHVLDGKIVRGSGVRIVRDGIVIHEGQLSTLKRFKDDVKEVASGYECGMSFENYNDIHLNDVIEAYVMEEIKA